MTLNHIVNKLLKKNIKQYILLSFCISITISFITGLGLLLFGDTIKLALVAGGSSSNIAFFSYGVILIACIIFIGYVFTLVLKYKSKDIGILICLGISKKNVAKLLRKEIFSLTFISILIGFVFSYPVTKVIWTSFSSFLKTSETELFVSYIGLVIGGIYAIAISLVIYCMLNHYLNTLDIMKILKADETIEDVKEIKPICSIVGIIFLPLGLFIFDFFSRQSFALAPILGALGMMLTPLGLYLISIRIPFKGKSVKKKNLLKYNKNIIYYSLLQLKGKQFVNSIFISSVILGISLFSVFFLLAAAIPGYNNIGILAYDYTLSYPANLSTFENSTIEDLAKKHNVTIKDLSEFETVQVIGSAWDYDEENFMEPILNEIGTDLTIINESTLNKMTNENFKIDNNSFIKIIDPQFGLGSTYLGYGHDETTLTAENGDKFKLKKIADIRSTEKFSTGTRDISIAISDEVYNKIRNVADDISISNTVVFNSANYTEEFDFANELKNSIISSTDKNILLTSDCSHLSNELQEIECFAESEHPTELSTTSSLVARRWAFYPMFKSLLEENSLLDYAVYFLLFAFISTLGVFAASIILYVKSLSSLWSDKAIYQNISYLGAKKSYIIKTIKRLQRLLFFVPITIAAIPSSAMALFMAIGGPTAGNSMLHLILAISAVLVIVFITVYICYKVSTKKIIKEILDFNIL